MNRTGERITTREEADAALFLGYVLYREEDGVVTAYRNDGITGVYSRNITDGGEWTFVCEADDICRTLPEGEYILTCTMNGTEAWEYVRSGGTVSMFSGLMTHRYRMDPESRTMLEAWGFEDGLYEKFEEPEWAPVSIPVECWMSREYMKVRE